MTEQSLFKWRYFEAEIILLCVHWYLRSVLSYRDIEELMQERGLHIDHTTIYRWVQHYAPKLGKLVPEPFSITICSRLSFWPCRLALFVRRG